MRQALGRGLGALIPEAQQKDAEHPEARVVKVPIGDIRPNHLQPRRHFDPEKLSELAQSIKENGLAQPIVVSLDPGTNSYELIAGERRLRAAELAGLKEIEVLVKSPASERHRLQLTLVENLQREDLNPIEVALGYLRLMKEYAITRLDRVRQHRGAEDVLDRDLLAQVGVGIVEGVPAVAHGGARRVLLRDTETRLSGRPEMYSKIR